MSRLRNVESLLHLIAAGSSFVGLLANTDVPLFAATVDVPRSRTKTGRPAIPIHTVTALFAW